MFGFLRQVGDYTGMRWMLPAIYPGFRSPSSHRPSGDGSTLKLIPSSDTAAGSTTSSTSIACEVCVRVCPTNLPVVDWVMNKATKKKELRNTPSISVCAFSAAIALSTAPQLPR